MTAANYGWMGAALNKTSYRKRHSKPTGWHRLFRVEKWMLYVAGGLVLIRLCLPVVVKAYVNSRLNQAKDYTGRIGEVDLSLWRGDYRIHQVRLLKKTGSISAPFFYAREIDLSVQWGELFHGALVGEVVLREPQINFVTAENPADTQNGKDERWDKMLQSLFPFQLNRVEIAQGEIHFQNEFSTPPVDIYLSQLSAVATNLTNARDLKQKLPSGLTARGTTVGGGNLSLDLQMNLLKARPTYEINCGLTNVNLVALNDFLRAYGKFDVERGDFAIYTSVASENENYEGYFKVFFKDLDVFAWEKERKKNILEIFWQAIVGGVATVFKNQPKDQLAMKVPISGTYSNSSVGVFTATVTLLQNAFISALVPKLDQRVGVEQVEKANASK